MKNLAYAVAAVILVIAVPAMAADGDKVSLTPKYLPGTHVFNISVNSESKAVEGETEVPLRNVCMEMTMEMTVSQPDAKGNKRMIIQFTKYKTAMSARGESGSYSSTQPDDEGKEPWASVVKAMLAAEITATVAPDGSISNVKGFDEAFSTVSDDTKSAALKNYMKSFFSEDGLIKLMLDGDRKMLPREPVAIGQEFKNTAKMVVPKVGEVDLTVEGKVVAIDKTDKGLIATIDHKAKIDRKILTTEPGATTKPLKNALKQFTMSQNGHGKFNVDIGQTTEQKSEQVMDMEVETPEGGGTMKVKQTSIWTFEGTFTPAK